LSKHLTSAVVVSGPSGAGKSTVLYRVLAEMKALRFSVSHTTRPPRAGEREGVDYHFVPEPRFEELRGAGAFLEWAKVHNHSYGTAHAEYEKACRDGVDLLLDLDVQGAAQVRLKLPDAVTVFILPPSYQDLERRLRGRGADDGEAFQRRLAAAAEETRFWPEYDYALVNDDLDGCVEDLKAIVRAARRRSAQVKGEAQGIIDTFPDPDERNRGRS
jgi:guanylate kinase